MKKTCSTDDPYVDLFPATSTTENISRSERAYSFNGTRLSDPCSVVKRNNETSTSGTSTNESVSFQLRKRFRGNSGNIFRRVLILGIIVAIYVIGQFKLLKSILLSGSLMNTNDIAAGRINRSTSNATTTRKSRQPVVRPDIKINYEGQSITTTKSSVAPRLVQCGIFLQTDALSRQDRNSVDYFVNVTRLEMYNTTSISKVRQRKQNTSLYNSTTNNKHLMYDNTNESILNAIVKPKKKKKDKAAKAREGCSPMYDWQTQTFPSCNLLYENSPFDSILRGTKIPSSVNRRDMFRSPMETRLLSHGFYRLVWFLQALNLPSPALHNSDDRGKLTSENNPYTPLAFKTIQIGKDFTEDIVEGCATDALVSERLTSSPHVVNIYGYCGTSSIYEFADGGDLELVVQHEFSPYRKNGVPVTKHKMADVQRLDTAIRMMAALADLHNVGENGIVPTHERTSGENMHSTQQQDIASIVHADLKPAQFVFARSGFGKNSTFVPKLSDFNLSQLLWKKNEVHLKNDTTSTVSPCKFYHKTLDNKMRAPEECRYEFLDEKVDVYHMGNILYFLLSDGTLPWQTAIKSKDKLCAGALPPLPKRLRLAREKYDSAITVLSKRRLHNNKTTTTTLWSKTDEILNTAMDMCHVADSKKRPSAANILQYLRHQRDQLFANTTTQNAME